MEINDLVVESLKSTHGLSGRIWTIENAEKYSTLSSPVSDTHQWISEEIFSLMTSLNTEGMTRADLCAAPSGYGSLDQTLRAVADDLVVLLGQDRLHYVELGPEPVKTSALIGYLLEHGVEPQDYTAIDINRASQIAMRDAVEPLLPAAKGFIVGGKQTYVLSEMQLSTPEGDDHIRRFYEHACMSRFSDLIGLKMGFEKRGTHQIVVSEIEHGDDRYRVAATLLPVSDGREEGYLLTNVCLKYTREQFMRIRQEYGGYKVIGEYCSGDGSVIYQLSKYCLG